MHHGHPVVFAGALTAAIIFGVCWIAIFIAVIVARPNERPKFTIVLIVFSLFLVITVTMAEWGAMG